MRFIFMALSSFILTTTACDGAMGPALDEQAAPLRGGTTTVDDVVVDGKIITANLGARLVEREEEPDSGYIVATGGESTVTGGLVVKGDDGPGVVRDCSAKAKDCNAECSVVGNGTCEAWNNGVECSLTYPCGENECTTTHTKTCI